MYAKFFKRVIDFTFALIALILLFPILLILTVVGAIAMGGNPFFFQMRPGMIDKKTGKERIFPLIKFRTMSNAKDESGKLLPDSQRLNKYGRLLRASSLDELPELLNILLGQLSCIGPRPLVPEYLNYYTEEERHRHDIKPGLTGLAQINGRSYISWEEIFAYDLEYVNNITFVGDIKIFFKTISKVFNRESVADSTLINKKEDGRLYVIHNGVEYVLHQPLDVERKDCITKIDL